jgi:arabinofuranosyltransferase
VARDRRLFALFVALFLLYAALFIYRTSFVVGAERYFSLFDDAMVSMRYAKNFASGHGLVWNPGGLRVEGYTNPLWVLFMAGVHLLPLAASKTSLVVQMAAALLLAANLFYVRRVAFAVSNGSRTVAWGAVVLTASYLPLNNWSLQGMEVSALVLLTSACTWIAVESIQTTTFSRRLYVLLGIGTLIRPDIAVVFAAFASYLLVADPVHRRQHVRWGVVVLGTCVAAQTAFRLFYYGNLLPNTYYLKLTGVPLIVRISRGLYVLLQFVWSANPLLFFLAAATALRRDTRVWLLLWVFAAQAAYSVYVGGDAWENWGGSNRYISIVMPAFFVLLSCAIHALASALAKPLEEMRAGGIVASRRAAAAIFVVIVALAVTSLNCIHGVGALEEALLLRPALHSGAGGENQEDVETAIGLRALTNPAAAIAVMRAGTIPYFAERNAIDMLGKNDAVIAHEPMKVPSGWLGFRELRPGHMKFDFEYSIGRGRPDVVVHLRQRTDLARPFLEHQYIGFRVSGACVFARRSSVNVIWDRVTTDRCEN